MPSIADSTGFQRQPANAFVSPFSAASPAVLYSSITIPGSMRSKGSCLSCALQDLTAQEIENFIEQLVIPTSASRVKNGLVATPSTTTEK